MRLPDPSLAYAQLQPVFSPLYQAFEHGTGVARRTFEEGGLERDPLVFAALSRLYAIPVLDAGARPLPGFVRTPLMNCGIQFAFGGFEVRVWKTTDGELPSATSSAKRRFVRQLPLGHGFSGEETADDGGARNLIIQWEYRPSSVVDLTLVCPKPGSSGPESVDVLWSLPIAHPGEAAAAIPSPTVPTDDIDDLDFIRPRDGGRAAGSS